MRERARELVGLYYEIVEPLFSFPRHRESLAHLLGPHLCYEECITLELFREAVEGREVCVLGPLPSTPKGCQLSGAPEGGIERALEAGLPLSFLVADLDAEERLLRLAIDTVPFLFVHLHGDNRERFLLFESSLKRRGVIYTSQTDSIGCVLPLGGFTDGDRAVIFPMLAGARAVRVFGYDFSRPVMGRKPQVSRGDKALKLSAAREVLRRSAELLGYDVEEGEVITLSRRRAANT
ncbi:MAG: hypothetical protein ABDH61_03690 [Acidilobaceae archaeon]